MAMVLDAFAVTIVSKMADVVTEKVVTVLGAKDELQRLQRKMERIKHVLHDADRKRIQSELVAGWVRELKDVMYDADDIIDLCMHKGRELLDGQLPTSTVCCSFPRLFSCCTSIPFRHEIGDMIKKLSQRLDEISRDMSGLNLVKSEPYTRVTTVDRRQTSAVINTSDIVGRGIEHATNDLVERIVNKDERKLLVFAITGMGGIGKTTLAKNIFNHPRVKSEFSITIWVCISQNFSETSLLKEIIRGAGRNPCDLQTKAELEPLLNDAVSGKTFLLVLDDVWRADVWVGLLRNPLQSGAVGSRILVTTRDTNIARQMGAAVPTHHVEKLPPEFGWELLCKSLYVTGEEEEMQSLRDVGAQIVENCHGLPLAIKSIAGVLATKERNLREWEKVLRKDAWSMGKLPEDLRGSLYLSYEDLPSNLKQCFLYCSLLPEDYEIYRGDLVRYWAAEGFAETQEDSFLEQAEECFEELVRRNLIYKENWGYKMHDLLRSLAQFMSQDESFCGEAQELTRVSTTTKLRRLTLTDKGELAPIPEPLLSQRSLRTMLLIREHSLGNDVFVGFPFLNNAFVRFPFLRVLSLVNSGIENIPDAVGNLLHLRLLDLGGARISSLPESIGNLTNLQVLNLTGCYSLDSLPKGITQLCNLRIIEAYATNLSFVPSGMGRLERLNHFNGFVVGGERGCNLEDLNSLLQLRVLEIYNLKEAVVAQNGPHVLGNKRHLKELVLICTKRKGEPPAEYNEGEIHRIQDVFEELAPPPPRLEALEIEGYFGHQFPSWMMSSSLGSLLPYLTRLSLHRCRNVVQLPPLVRLPELRHLTICDARAAVSLGSAVYGSGSTLALFPKLESFRLDGAPNLQEWSFCIEEEITVFPNLLNLFVRDCQSLPWGVKGSPLKELYIDHAGLRAIDNLPHLSEDLRISNCQSLEKISHLPALKEKLDISNCQSLERISHLPALRELMIRGDCPLLIHVEKLDSLERLTLDIWEMDFLPEGLLRLLQEPQLHQDDNFRLELRCNKDILFSKCAMGGEHWPIIQNIPRFEAYGFGSDHHNYLRYTKEPHHYETNLPLGGEH